MKANSLLEFIQRFYYGDFDNVLIVDISNRTEFIAGGVPVSSLQKIKVKDIENLSYDEVVHKNVIRIN